MDHSLHSHHRKSGHAYRLGDDPRSTLATLLDLGLSEAAISRYLALNATSLAELFKKYDFKPVRSALPSNKHGNIAARSCPDPKRTMFERIFARYYATQ